jgi:phage terminase small subunit
MGRPRKSPDERLIEGNRSRTPIPVDVYVPEGAPFVPEHLSDDAQACAELIIRSFKVKRLSAPDSYALAMFAGWWAWAKEAQHRMNDPEFGPVSSGSTGQPAVNPWFKILAEASREMRAWGTKLYLSPADRAGLAVDGEKPKSKFGELVAIQGGRSASSTSFNA